MIVKRIVSKFYNKYSRKFSNIYKQKKNTKKKTPLFSEAGGFKVANETASCISPRC